MPRIHVRISSGHRVRTGNACKGSFKVNVLDVQAPVAISDLHLHLGAALFVRQRRIRIPVKLFSIWFKFSCTCSHFWLLFNRLYDKQLQNGSRVASWEPMCLQFIISTQWSCKNNHILVPEMFSFMYFQQLLGPKSSWAKPMPFLTVSIYNVWKWKPGDHWPEIKQLIGRFITGLVSRKKDNSRALHAFVIQQFLFLIGRNYTGVSQINLKLSSVGNERFLATTSSRK